MADQPVQFARPSWSATAFTLSFVAGIAVGLATVLLAIGRDIGCSVDDDCGSGAWLVVLAVIAVMAVGAPLVGLGALKGRVGHEAGWVAASMFGPSVMWVVAFVVIAT